MCGIQTVCQVQDEGEESDNEGFTLLYIKSHGVMHSPPIQETVKLDDCLLTQVCPGL